MMLDSYVVKKLIKNCPKKLENIYIKGLSSDTRNLKGELFLQYQVKNLV